MEVVERLRSIHRENERLFERLVDGEQRFRSLARAVWEVQEEERRRVARELHDGLGQTLTALKIRLERLGAREGVDPELAEEIDAGVALAVRSLEEARRLAHLLRPQVLDDLGLYPALRWLARTLGEWTGFVVHVELPERPERPEDSEADRLDSELETLAFRVIQEGLTNSMKHSGAEGARVRVERASRSLHLEVVDDGDGFDAESALARSLGGAATGASAAADGGDARTAAGFGLRGMRERVELAGGRFALHSAPGEGTRMTAELPLPPEGPSEGGAR